MEHFFFLFFFKDPLLKELHPPIDKVLLLYLELCAGPLIGDWGAEGGDNDNEKQQHQRKLCFNAIACL